MRELKVELGERSYPIYFGENLIDDIGSLLVERGISQKSPLIIITDTQVAKHHLAKVEQKLAEAGFHFQSAIVESGEQSKSLSVLESLTEQALLAGLDRKSAVIALGGGVVGDLAGFFAASYMRGIRFVQVPTTILAHDSSVGGKVAVNHRLAKNIIGAFHQPELVLFDTATLRTLPEREIRAGLAEMIKHGLIWDRDFTYWLDKNRNKLLALDTEALQEGLYVGCRVKTIVVSQDEKEGGLRAILNLGHTIGHALEAVAGYQELLHGEAISIGMVGSAKLAVRFGYDQEIETETTRLLAEFGLPTQIPQHLDSERIMEALKRDKKVKEGKLLFVIPTAIGKAEIEREVPEEWVRDVLEQLKQGER